MANIKINREEIYNKCNGHCAYCGKEITIKEMQIDHVEPLFRNHTDEQLKWYKRERGTDEDNNLLPSCARCNRWKSTYSLETFREIVQKSIERLERDTPNFRLARDFGLLKLPEKEVVFYFELESTYSPYCPECGSCGEDGCCSAISCKQSPNGDYCETYLKDLKFAYLMYKDLMRLFEEDPDHKETIDKMFDKNWDIIFKK